MKRFCLLALFAFGLLSACGGDVKPSSEEEASLSADDLPAEPIADPAAGAKALEAVNVVVDELDDVRQEAPEPPKPVEPATADEKLPEWAKQSPFYGKGACAGWDNKPETITADCCKYVLANYGGLLNDPKKYDLEYLMFRDPYVNSCREFNDEFRDAFERVEEGE